LRRLLSQAGKSFSFDDRAQGFGRGEGIGCIVLKKLDAAIADGDRIRAVIRNTGMNQDGRTQGISMPNGEAQAELIRSVYGSAGLDVRDTGYVEAHGTGTKVGDPIEARALQSVFGEGRTKKEPLYLGSIKSNIGHAEGSSGIVAVIKTALMLEKGFILPNINFKKPNEAIPLVEWNMKVRYAAKQTLLNCVEADPWTGSQDASSLAPRQEVRKHQQLWIWRNQLPRRPRSPTETFQDRSSQQPEDKRHQ
jgi:acyl transferase domain-containing protein